ncbi:KpsF/GutQ family sugar-phosphate isomerase [uncultured Succinatimonas sp.]|uniref:KpsF/GutQ family sugar-phosphate isomerase n=1 Tax=uncultured Succinatimonas sp. TaxID=1262973 RepID=UPI0026001192|nr:KpsF/GutQ family sugar-phosphate isomerase [uncultured Succinatimonas sp.]
MIKETCINAGKRVLQDEAHALLALVPTIGDNFEKACRLLLSCKGKVVLTGVGKSGHIATKTASTLASTGTPAFFVQAGEAAHGDLGMIGNDDVVIAISNSGEGSELKIMIPILKRRGIPLIAITGEVNSSLGKEADITLSAHVEKEACPLNLAPTSSSTAELALGDALAIALLEARGFTEHDFALSHPGGALGRRLLVRCKDLMHTEAAMPKVKDDISIKDALFEMSKKSQGIVTIVDNDGKLAGVYTDGDLRRTLNKGVDLNKCISTVMTRKCTTIKAETLAAQAVVLMQNKKITAMVVVDEDNRPIGTFNIQDLLRAGIV